MPNQRAKDKRLVGFFGTKEEAESLKEAAALAGFESLADYFRWVSQVKPRPGMVCPRGTEDSEG